jgi:hypothetical protein
MAGFGSRAQGSYVFSGICVAAVLGGIAWMVVTGGHHLGPPDAEGMGREVGGDEQVAAIPYQGETVKLRRAYADYEDFSKDDEALPPASMAQVDRLMSRAPIAHSFDSRMDMLVGLSELAFPGAGTMQMGDVAQPDGSVLSGHALLIPSPSHSKLRYFVFRGRGEKFTLIDDFVDDGKLLVRVRAEGDQLVYSNGKGEAVLTRTPGAAAAP